MDNVKDAADKAVGVVDKGVSGAVQLATHTAQDLLARGSEVWDTARSHSEATLGYAEQLQDQAFDTLKEGIEYCIVHPYISYPAAAAFVLTAMPGVRRLAYRVTLGRLRNPEAVVSSSEAKLSTLTTKTNEFAAESKKLQERAQLAEEEMTRGYNKLKAARQELQRLESSVAKSERLAANVLQDLRSMRSNSRATELRSEVAVKLSALKQQRAALQKEIKWIVKRDI